MTARATFAFAVITMTTGLCFAQDQDEEIHHHNVTLGGGAAIPAGSSTNYFSTAPLFSLGYGYRFNRWFQADIGFEAAFGAASNQNAEATDFGAVQGGDHEFMVPIGGRVYLPTRLKRISASVGAGTAYLHYSETIPNNGFVMNNCYSCTSRGGWGGYGLGNITYFLDSSHTFRAGTTLQYVAGSTNGQSVGNVPALKTTDHWVNLIFEFGLSF